MTIPPIQPPIGAGQYSAPDPTVDELKQLWDDWYKNPTKESAEKLIDFLSKNRDHLEQLAKNCPPPKPFVDFDHSIDAAVNTLQNWIDHGCPPNHTIAPSEFVNDVFKWISYAG